MRIPPFRPLAVVLLSLALVTLACARANLPIVPVTPDYATRQPPTATSTSLPPTATVPLPTDTAAPPTDTPAAPPTAADTLAAPTLTPAAASAAASPTSPARATTQAPAATSVPATAVPPTPTPTHSAPTQTPLPTPTAVPPTIPPQPGQTVSIPANATFTQKFSATNQGGEMIGDPGYLIDGKTVTWAALDGGHAAWVLDLGSAQNLAGVRVYAQKPRSGDPTTLLAVEVSNDGQSWQAVFTGTGDCGEPNCDILPQMKFVDIGFSPVSARYLRLRGGPTRFGFAEILVAVMP